QIWIGTCKLRVDLAREKPLPKAEVAWQLDKGQIRGRQAKLVLMGQGVKGSKTSKDALLSSHLEDVRAQRRVGSINQSKRPLELDFNVKKEDYEWLKNCYIGQTYELEPVPGL
ncbi:hypothetical protein Ancab_022620, partial [Ancistrocladus abbreviatus]